MITGKTSSGFEYTIEEDARDDMELLEALIDLDSGKTGALKTVIEQLLGPEQKTALYEFHRNKKTGRVPASKIMSEFSEILTGAGEQSGATKN